MHATSLGTQNLRSEISIPDEIRTLPEVLRAHGYFTSNNAKTDYNFDPSNRWDELGTTAHWRGRADGQPFFSVFNLMISHEGPANRTDEEIFAPLARRHDPDQAVLPPYFPDTPEMRRIWARYHDLLSLVDLQSRDILAELEADGLADNTIVFFWSDHGFGLPRYKAAAELVGDASVPVPVLSELLSDPDSGVRFWAAISIQAMGQRGWPALSALLAALNDPSPSVQIAAAEALCGLDRCSEGLPVLARYLDDEREWLALQAATGVRQIGTLAAPILPRIRETRRMFSGTVGEGGYRDWSYAMFIGFAMDQALENNGEKWE